MKIPEQHYIGMIVNRSAGESMDQLPLAFMTPYGEDKAFEKRKDTVIQWVRDNSRGGAPRIDPIIVKNEPQVGFHILGCVSRMGGHKWRIEDPRGFELEISSDNMLTLIQEGVIDNSEVLEPCIWVRGRSDNFLLPISSEAYQEAVAATSLSKKSVGMRDIAVGYTITLQNGNKGRYAGKLILVHESRGGFEEYPRHILVDEETKTVYASSSIKIAEINYTQTWTAEEALATTRANIDFTKRWGNVSSGSHICCVMVLAKGMSFTSHKVKIKSKMEHGAVIFYPDKYHMVGFVNHNNEFDANPIDTFLWERENVISHINNRDNRYSYPTNRAALRLNLATLQSEGVEAQRPQWVITAEDGFITEFI